jgi:putative DNA primase/helicase
MPIAINHGKAPLRSPAGPVPATATPAYRFARHLCDSGDYRHDGAGLCRWTGSSWQCIQESDAARIALEWLSKYQADRASAKQAAECCATAILALPKVASSANANFIPLKNAWLRVESDGSIVAVKPQKAEAVTHELAIEFPAPLGEYVVPPVDSNTRFAKFLATSLPNPEVRSLVQEYVGYTMLPHCNFHAAQLWVGSGRNGKSVLAHVVSELHSRKTSIPLDRLDGFELEAIVGASLVVCDETPKHGINQQAFKTLVSGGEVLINPKNRKPYSYRPRAKWIVCSNHIPATKDHSDGWWRRLQVIEWEAQIDDKDVITGLEGDIVAHELREVLNWALQGLQRLVRRGKFEIPDCVARVKDDIQTESNTVKLWARECAAAESATHMTTKKDLFEAYVAYCEENRMHACGKEEFFRRIYQLFPAVKENVTRVRNGGGREYRLPMTVGSSSGRTQVPREPVNDDSNPFA